MSGGHFGYNDMKISDIIDILEKDEKYYPTKKIQILTRCVMDILHSYDWFMSGDTSKEEFESFYLEQLRIIKKEIGGKNDIC